MPRAETVGVQVTQAAVAARVVVAQLVARRVGSRVAPVPVPVPVPVEVLVGPLSMELHHHVASGLHAEARG